MKKENFKSIFFIILFIFCFIITCLMIANAALSQEPAVRADRLQPELLPPPPIAVIPDFTLLGLALSSKQISAIEKSRETHIKKILSMKNVSKANRQQMKKPINTDLIQNEQHEYLKEVFGILTPDQLAMLFRPRFSPDLHLPEGMHPCPPPPEYEPDELDVMW